MIVSGKRVVTPSDEAAAQRFRYAAIPTEVAQRIRSTLRDDFRNELRVWISDAEGNPCRHCLRMTRPGDRLILFAYRPFATSGPYAETGPIFIHADACARYDGRSGFPEDFTVRALTLRAYGNTERGDISIVDAEVSQPGCASQGLTRLFAAERVQFVHARNQAWGCYDFRIDRATAINIAT